VEERTKNRNKRSNGYEKQEEKPLCTFDKLLGKEEELKETVTSNLNRADCAV
jgi:hypothetical protein